MLLLCRRLLNGIRRKPLRAALVFLLVVAAAAASGFAYRQVWLARHLAAARQALEQRDFPAAWAQLAPCLEACPRNSEVHLLAARASWQSGKPEDAREHLARCEQLGGDYEAVILEYTLLRVRSGDTAHGEGFLLERANQGHPDTAVILEALAEGYEKSFRYRQALAVVDLWVKRQPESARAWYWHGHCAEHMASTNMALADYRRAVDLNPPDEESRRCLADRLLYVHDAAAALEQFQYLHEHHPDEPAYLLGMARANLDGGNAAAALQALDPLAPNQRETGWALAVRGQALGKLGRREEALPLLRRAVELLPREPEVVYALATCLTQLHRTGEAAVQLARWNQINDDLKRVSDLARQVQQNPRDADLRYQLGVIYLRVGMEPEGVAWLLSAVREDPGYRPAHAELARYYENRGDHARAEQYRQQVRSGG